jgi:hypothetical protein
MEPVRLTRRWVKDVVIGLNLCPFARVPFEAGKIRYTLCEAGTVDDAHSALIREVADFVQLPAEQAETSLFIVPQGLEIFSEYLEVLEDAQDALQDSGLDNMLQLASFHPDYCFEGLDEDDPANYTNRSPFPMFHLIRQDGLAVALESWPDPASIPRRNIALLREMGLDAIHKLLDGNGK